MCVELYCRECAIHFSSLSGKVEHNHRVHQGFAQPPPNISHSEFENMNFWSTIEKAHRCPVCLDTWPELHKLIEHVHSTHPVRNEGDPLAQTCPEVIEKWFRTVDSCSSPNLRGYIMCTWQDETDAKVCPYCETYFPTLRQIFNHILCNHHFSASSTANDWQVYGNWIDLVDEIYPGQCKKMAFEISLSGEISDTFNPLIDYEPLFTKPYPGTYV